MSLAVLKNFMWRFAERCAAQGVSFLITLVLARLLDPDAYGKIALITVFITISNVFVNSGFGSALIQKKDADDLDFSSVFYFNVFMCCVIYMIMFWGAVIIAHYYKDMSLVPVIRVLSLTIVISGVKNIQQAYVSRTMQFRNFFFSTLGGTIASAIIGVALAYLGFGIWALVAQQLSNQLVDTIILWVTVKWKPKRFFSIARLRELFSYGWKLLVSGLLDTVFGNMRQLIVGKLYTSSDLAYYNQGGRFPEFIIANVNSSIDSVLLPAMSKQQDNRHNVKIMTRRAIKTSIYVMAPLMMGLAFCGRTIISFLLTDKWLPCVPYLRIFCISYMFYPIHTANLNAIKAMGRSDLFLKLEIAKKIMALIILMVTVKYGIMAMTYSILLESFIAQIINSWPNKRLLDYGYVEQLMDILPEITLSVFMAICVGIIGFLKMPIQITLLLQVFGGIAIYIGISIYLKFETFFILYDSIKSVIGAFSNKA